MEKIKTEKAERRRGRPKLDARITEEYAPSRRQALNKMYMYEGIHLLSVVATEIQNSEVLWQEDRTAITLKSRDGILEQLGRMAVQDKLGRTDCVYLANLAIAAVQNGYTTREVELEKLVVSAYEDKVKGVVPEALCVQLINRYEDERRGKLEQRTQLTAQLEATQEDEQATDEWLAVIRDYAQLEELDRPTLLRLVKRIEVGEKYEIAGETHRDIKIYYNFVGYVEL